MSTDISPSLSWLGRRRVVRLGLGAAFAFAALGGGCAEDPPADVVTAAVPDAGPACEQGARGCACPCQEDLLCVAGRCLETEGPSEPAPQPEPRPRPTPPPSSILDAGAEPAPADADADADAGTGGSDAQAPDASD
jgi:hypothetical protein